MQDDSSYPATPHELQERSERMVDEAEICIIQAATGFFVLYLELQAESSRTVTRMKSPFDMDTAERRELAKEISDAFMNLTEANATYLFARKVVEATSSLVKQPNA